ncbi:transposase [Candidatus Enterovibrio altilux]|uniref:Mobile element protein n=1 Tax=Candidatus Enterovibrio altilux TaxID=1927128 RepID=A0A291B8Q3_9GAMM|nr:transposase [Candidatus Enterovibrio luxaltus]ATF09386.1 Mobile element protein [Candidatus Enterovibrio luxaltus]
MRKLNFQSILQTVDWKQYHQTLINHRALTFWIDEEATQLWNQTTQSNHRKLRLFRYLAITTVLMIKCVFSMLLRELQGFMHFVFKLTRLSLLYSHYECMSKRAKTINIMFKTTNNRTIQHLAIDSTGFKIYDEANGKYKEYNTDEKRVI